MDEQERSFAELVSLSSSIERQQEINASNIAGSLQSVERRFRDEVHLCEDVCVDHEIWEDSSTIFGWSKVVGVWHIVIGERETFVHPNGETVIYPSAPKRVLDCDASFQMQVFRKIGLLIDEIHRTLQARHARTQADEQEIAQQIGSVVELLGMGDGPHRLS